MSDVVLRNGVVVDGTGKPPFKADVVVRGGVITRIAHEAGEVEGAREVDATGCLVMPGFIDMHSHCDLVYLSRPVPDAKIRQGVTTELIGQDGLGTAPVSPDNVDLLSSLTKGLLGYTPRSVWTWGTLGDYLRKLDETGTPTNIAPLVSHGPLRIETMGMARRAPTPHELDKMLEGMRIAAREGAFGFSTGLVYAPCSYSDTSELEVLVQETARFGGIFVVHMRDEGHYLLRSFEEVAGIALAAGAHLHISHLQAYGRMNWRLMDDLLERVEELAGDGLEVSWDRYPYLASSTVLMAVLPDWTLADGAEALVQRLRDPDFRRRLHVEFEKGPDVWHNRPAMVGWGSIVVSGVMSDRNKWMEGKSCAEIASELGQQPLDVVLDLLADENLAVTMVTHYGSGKVLSSVLCHTRATLGTDGIICGHPHPRLYGSYPRFFRDFVLDRRLLSWEEAVRKTSGLSADTLGLKTRGYVKTGMAADLVVLSPEDLNDRATYQEPAVYPEGIRYVLVNGEIAVEPQRGFTGTLSGKVLRKGID